MSGEAPAWTRAAATGDWAAFPGLPRSLAEADLLRGLGRPASSLPRRPARLGSRQRSVVELDGLRYWLDAESVVLVELEAPRSMLAADGLIAALGAPDREGAGRYRKFGATTTEYVYAGRGLAVTVAESYDDPPGFEPYVAAVHLFAAGDLQSFVLELGGNDRGGPQL